MQDRDGVCIQCRFFKNRLVLFGILVEIALILFLTSWASGAYYYVIHYGKNVKPIIVAGSYPWAHTFFMEAKEHVFLIIPFLALVLWLVSAGLGIAQTPLTATVGNSVMAQLRVRLFEHLQAMELGFFTRTKTGIIQSRLQNDVGGVAGVLSNTVSSVIGNTVTVIAAFVAMLILSWQLTIVAVVLLPLLVVAQRRVGQVRARIATKTQESLSPTAHREAETAKAHRG